MRATVVVNGLGVNSGFPRKDLLEMYVSMLVVETMQEAMKRGDYEFEVSVSVKIDESSLTDMELKG